MQKISILSVISICLWFVTTQTSIALETINITLSPKYPGPNSEVTLRVDSLIFPIDGAHISWFIDNQIIKSGIGEKALTLSTKELGEQTTIKMVAITTTGEQAEKNISVTPSTADILWEADTYTPPFYKGKALPTAKSNIRLTMIPQVSTQGTDKDQYFPEWIIDKTRTIVTGEKPYALVTTTWEGSFLNILVRAKNESGTIITETSETIKTRSPILRLYENRPLLGIDFAHNLSSSQNTVGQLVIRGIPFYISRSDREKGYVEYLWKINGKETSVGMNPEEVTVSGEGTHQVSASIKNSKQILQQGNAFTTITLTQ